MRRMFMRLLRWFRRIFHRSTTKQIPFSVKELTPRVGYSQAKNRSMIVRAGSSMKRGRLWGVR